MYVAVGDGAVSPQTVINRTKRLLAVSLVGEDLELQDTIRRRADRPAGEGVIVEGFDDVWIRIARCCGPVPGDDLAGFVTVGRGVSVHRADCANITRLGDRTDRMIEASWAPGQVTSFSVLVPGGGSGPSQPAERCHFGHLGCWRQHRGRVVQDRSGPGSRAALRGRIVGSGTVEPCAGQDAEGRQRLRSVPSGCSLTLRRA